MAQPQTVRSDTLDALVVGPTFLDIVLDGIETLPAPGEEAWASDRRIAPGGVANTAVGAARLGMLTRLVTAIGQDVVGSMVAALLDVEPGLLLSPGAGVDSATPITVAVTAAADRLFLSHGVIERSPAMTVEAEAAEHAATIFTALEVEPPAWLDARRRHGSTVFAGVGWDDRHGWSHDVIDNLGRIDVFVLNEAEAIAYTGASRIEDALTRLADVVAIPVITRGADGVLAFDAAAGRSFAVPAVTGPLVDTTGAGDEFVAALMRATQLERPLLERLRFAALCAGLSTRRLGGSSSAPTLADLRDWWHTAAPATDGYAFLPDLLDSCSDADREYSDSLPSPSLRTTSLHTTEKQ